MLLLRDKTNVAAAFDSFAFPKQTTVHTHTHTFTHADTGNAMFVAKMFDAEWPSQRKIRNFPYAHIKFCERFDLRACVYRTTIQGKEQ